MTEQLTRREFVATAAVMGAGLTIAGTAGCTARPGSEKAAVETPSTHYGEDGSVGKRILVGYATRTGSTVGVAQAVGETLAARGFAVDVRPMKDRPPLEGYDAVVLGSAINGGQWLPEAVTFVEANRGALGKVPVAMFCVHAMNCGTDPADTKRRLAYLDKERALVRPAHEGFFAGIGLTEENSNALTRWLFKAFGGDIEGDGRDWTAIRAWAAGV
jgi:menaquinone-dependent protoporphyrinogen oxidase